MDHFIRSCQKCNIKIGENETIPVYLNGKKLFCCTNCVRLMSVLGINDNNKRDLLHSITEEIKNQKNLAYSNNYIHSLNKYYGQKIAHSKNQLISMQVHNYSKISRQTIQSPGLPKSDNTNTKSDSSSELLKQNTKVLSNETILTNSLKMNPTLNSLMAKISNFSLSFESQARQQANNKALHDSGQQQNYNAPRDSGQQQNYNAPRDSGQQQNYKASHDSRLQQIYSAPHDFGQQQNYNAPRDSGQQQNYKASHDFGQQQNYNAPHDSRLQQIYNAPRDSGQQQNYNAAHDSRLQQIYSAPHDFGQQQNYNALHDFGQQQNYNAPHHFGQQQNFNAPVQQHYSASYDSLQQTHLENQIGQRQEDKNSLSNQQNQGQKHVDPMIQPNGQLQLYAKWSDPSQTQPTNWSDNQSSDGEPYHDEHLLDQEVHRIMNNEETEYDQYEVQQHWQMQQNYSYRQVNRPVVYNNMLYYPVPAHPSQPCQYVINQPYPQALPPPYMVPTNEQAPPQPNATHFMPHAPNQPNALQPYGTQDSHSVQDPNGQPLESNRPIHEMPPPGQPYLMHQNQQPYPPQCLVQTPHGYMLVQNTMQPYPVHLVQPNLRQRPPRQYLSPQPTKVVWPHLEQQQQQLHQQQLMHQQHQQQLSREQRAPHQVAQSDSQPFQRESRLRSSGQRCPDNRRRGGQHHIRTTRTKPPGSEKVPLLPLPKGREQHVAQQNNDLPPRQKPPSPDKSQPPQDEGKSDLQSKPRCADNVHPPLQESKSNLQQKPQRPGNLRAPQQEGRSDLQQTPKCPDNLRPPPQESDLHPRQKPQSPKDDQAIGERQTEPQQPEKRDQPDTLPKPRKVEVPKTSGTRPRAHLCEKCFGAPTEGTSRERDGCNGMQTQHCFLSESSQAENKTHQNCQAEDKIQSDSAAADNRGDLLPDDEKYHDIEWLNKQIEDLELKELQFAELEANERDEVLRIEKHLSELRDRSPPAGTSPKPDEPILRIQEAAQVQPIDEQLQPPSSPQESTTGKRNKKKKRKSQSSRNSEDSQSSSGRRGLSQGSRRSSYSSSSSSRRSSVSISSRPERVNVNGDRQRETSRNNRQDRREPENNRAEEIPRAESNHPAGPGRDEPSRQPDLDQPPIVNLLNDKKEATPENDAQAPNDEPNGHEAPRDQQNGNGLANGHRNSDAARAERNLMFREILEPGAADNPGNGFAPIRHIRRAHRRNPGRRPPFEAPHLHLHHRGANGQANGNGHAPEVAPLSANVRRANHRNNGALNERDNRLASPARQNQERAQILNRGVIIGDANEDDNAPEQLPLAVQWVNRRNNEALRLNRRENRDASPARRDREILNHGVVIGEANENGNAPEAAQQPANDNAPEAPQRPADCNAPEAAEPPADDQPANREASPANRAIADPGVIIDQANENGHAPEWPQEPVNGQPNENAPPRPNSPLAAAAPAEDPAPALAPAVRARRVMFNELFRQQPPNPPRGRPAPANGQNARPWPVFENGLGPRRPRFNGQMRDELPEGQRELPRNGENRGPDDERRREQDEDREEGGWRRHVDRRRHRPPRGQRGNRPQPPA